MDVPDIIDISHMRSKGLQPGEELLPEGGMCYNFALPKPLLVLFRYLQKLIDCAYMF